MKDFKNFVLNNELEDVVTYCEKKAVELGCAEDEIGDKARESAGTFYCPDEDIAAQFGFLTEKEMVADCEDIAVRTGALPGDVMDALHQSHSVSFYDEGFYGGGQIIFADLNSLAKSFERN